MSIVLEYTVGAAERRALFGALNPASFRQYRGVRIGEAAVSLIAVAFGLYAAQQARLLAVGSLIGCIGLYHVVQLLLTRRQFDAIATASAVAGEDRHVRLTIDETGLRELCEGIESFAPWSAVRSFTDVGETLVLKLAGGLWALVPHAAFEGRDDLPLPAFHDLLARKAIPGRSASL